MKKEDYPPQSGAGGAEPLQNKENCCGNLCESGAGEVESGAGMPTEDKAVIAATITSDTVLVEVEKDNSYSLLQVEKDGGDIREFIGRPVEVRSLNSDRKFCGTFTKWDDKNAIATVTIKDGEISVYSKEVFVIG